ncbi:hypothetical protein HMPREF0185_00430 [Brevundimonas diminuta 470-4]|nr:hypothetical protein HMPREF0185_00430 [Brevundimonas diminuta 470-4]
MFVFGAMPTICRRAGFCQKTAEMGLLLLQSAGLTRKTVHNWASSATWCAAH